MFKNVDKKDYVDAGAMVADIDPPWLDFDQYLHFGIISVVTAAAGLTGNLITEGSNDKVSVVVLDTQAVAADGVFNVQKVDPVFRYVRHRWQATGGTGTLNSHVFARGI